MQDTPLDILSKALYNPDVKEQLKATTRFRKCLSVSKLGVWAEGSAFVDESICIGPGGGERRENL